MIGTNELIIIALVVMVLFGASAIPKFARSLGQAKKEFDRGSKDESAAGESAKSGETDRG